MRRIALLGAVLVLVLGTFVYVQAQRGGSRGRSGGGGAGMALERDWTLICFEMYITGDQFDNVRSAFNKAYGDRKKGLEGMRSGGDPQQMEAKIAQIQKDLEAKYAMLFTKEQLERLNRLKAPARGGGGRRR